MITLKRIDEAHEHICNDLHQLVLGALQEKMITRKHLQNEGGLCLLPPCQQFLPRDAVVGHAAEHCDRAVERPFRRVAMLLAKREISSEQGNNMLQELFVSQHFRRYAAKTT